MRSKSTQRQGNNKSFAERSAKTQVTVNGKRIPHPDPSAKAKVTVQPKVKKKS